MELERSNLEDVESYFCVDKHKHFGLVARATAHGVNTFVLFFLYLQQYVCIVWKYVLNDKHGYRKNFVTLGQRRNRSQDTGRIVIMTLTQFWTLSNSESVTSCLFVKGTFLIYLDLRYSCFVSCKILSDMIQWNSVTVFYILYKMILKLS